MWQTSLYVLLFLPLLFPSSAIYFSELWDSNVSDYNYGFHAEKGTILDFVLLKLYNTKP